MDLLVPDVPAPDITDRINEKSAAKRSLIIVSSTLSLPHSETG